MNLDLVLARFDAEVRANPAPPAGIAVERRDGLVLLTGGFNYVSAWDLTTQTMGGAVAEQVAWFRARGEELMWRVYDHDGPPGLAACLAEAGFEPAPPGTLMFFDLAGDVAGAPADGVEVRRVRTLEDLDGFVSAGGKAFGHEEAWQRAAFAKQLDDPDMALFIACVAGEAVASARLEMAPGRTFGQLFGGGVAPAHRRRGLYRALVAARVAEARARGLAYLSIEARDTSRPILERLGFVPAGRETTWTLRPYGLPGEASAASS